MDTLLNPTLIVEVLSEADDPDAALALRGIYERVEFPAGGEPPLRP